MIHHKVKSGSTLIVLRLMALFRQPIFITVTLVGHSAIAAGTFGLYYLEWGVNPAIRSLLDTLFWAVATVTTVGYGPVIPVTTAGKILGIGMMILGSILFWCYTALFATALVSPELRLFEEDVKALGKAIGKLQKSGNDEAP
jgi:hypothetical protein